MFVLPELPYDYDALEPFIDTETMHIHHDKHHATYVKNLNDFLADDREHLNMPLPLLLKSLDNVSDNIRQKVKNNAGGVYNHNLFWEVMCPADNSAHPLKGELFDAINLNFGTINDFQNYFTEKALNRFGSGWVWLVIKKVEDGKHKLEITDTSNQDSPITEGKIPILCLDVWEHAYYLKYRNLRADYVKAWWNVVNWKKVEELFMKEGELR